MAKSEHKVTIVQERPIACGYAVLLDGKRLPNRWMLTKGEANYIAQQTRLALRQAVLARRMA